MTADVLPRACLRHVRLAVAAFAAALAAADAWAQEPARAAAPEAAWTPSADAPEGLLTPVEVIRHDQHIARAQAGDIDIVFFGSTDTEKWSWPLGREVWERAFGSRRAANFGSQGTRLSSLTWRMRNGELDGYRAKVVVLEALSVGRDSGLSEDDYPSGVTAVLDEIRARQPQAKILLMGPLPRGPGGGWRWRNAVLAPLADDETVFFVDISDRFFRPDGSFDYTMSKLGGTATPAFEAWAEELEPWFNRFVD